MRSTNQYIFNHLILKRWKVGNYSICVYVLQAFTVCGHADGVPEEETCHLFMLCRGNRERDRKRKISILCI